MSVGPGWRRLFRISRDRQSAHRDVDDEIAFHLAMREEKLRRLGASPSEAEAAARARFGDPGQVRDECVTIDQRYAREVRVMEWIESVWSDIRYAFRTLRRMPAFTLVATLTLSLGSARRRRCSRSSTRSCCGRCHILMRIALCG